MFDRARNRGVERVDVKLLHIEDIARDQHTLKEMHVVERLGDAGGLIEVSDLGVSVTALGGIDEIHRRPGGAVMHATRTDRQIKLRFAAMEREVGVGDSQHVLDQRARKPDATILALDCTGPGQELHARRRRIGEPYGLQGLKRLGMHALHLRLGQRAVGAACHPGPDGLDIDRQRGSPRRNPCRPSSRARAARCQLVWFTHLQLPPPRVDRSPLHWRLPAAA